MLSGLYFQVSRSNNVGISDLNSSITSQLEGGCGIQSHSTISGHFPDIKDYVPDIFRNIPRFPKYMLRAAHSFVLCGTLNCIRQYHTQNLFAYISIRVAVPADQLKAAY